MEIMWNETNERPAKKLSSLFPGDILVFADLQIKLVDALSRDDVPAYFFIMRVNQGRDCRIIPVNFKGPEMKRQGFRKVYAYSSPEDFVIETKEFFLPAGASMPRIIPLAEAQTGTTVRLVGDSPVSNLSDLLDLTNNKQSYFVVSDEVKDGRRLLMPTDFSAASVFHDTDILVAPYQYKIKLNIEYKQV